MAAWDDDLIPRHNCMEKLATAIDKTGAVAAGGMYPSPSKPGKSYLNSSGFVVPDGRPRHLQFFDWDGEHQIIERRFLHSSYLYNRKATQKVGGFCTEYSQHSFRAETDFTLRLNAHGGKLIVVTDAVADHHFGEGGTRAICGAEKEAMLQHDLNLFNLRMRTLGIDPNY